MRKLVTLVLLAFAAAAAPAQAADNVGFGPSGWFWGSPSPQGSTLNDIVFSGGAGYAVGDSGTVLKTADNGLDWQGLGSGVRSDLERVRVLDGSVVLAGGGCSLVRSDDGGASFARLHATTAERNCKTGIASFSFVDPLVGYVVYSNGAVARTTNGGVSFAARAALPGTAAAGGSPAAAPADVYFLSSETGIALAGKTVLRTTDGGASWTQVFTAAQELNGLVFATATTGYAGGDDKTLLKTTDGGVTWTPIELAADLPAADLTRLHCSDDQPGLCLFATRQGDQLLRSSGGGASVTSVEPYDGRKVLAGAFSSTTLAVAVGQAGATAVSADGGKNWAPVGVSVGTGLDHLRSLEPGSVAAAGANGALARTANGGADWTSIAVPTTKSVRDVSFPSASAGFALDGDGALFKTVDGGTHWTPAPETSVSGARTVYAPEANTVLLLGSAGLARSTDGGATFATPELPALTDYDRTADGLVLYGGKALFAANATGGERKRLPRPGGPKSRIVRADFLDAENGYVLNRGGRLWLTRNSGASWSEIRTTGTGRAYDMTWGDANTGYLAVDKLVPGERAGFVLRTDDRGKHWRPQLAAPTPLRQLVANGGPNALVGLAGASQLLYTATGGDHGTASTLTITPNKLRISKATRVKVSGQLGPAIGGAEVHVALRRLGGGRWTTKVATTDDQGRFKVKLRVERSSVLVARWLGDAGRNGAGSNIVAIRKG